MHRIQILTLFPEMFSGPLSHSIIKRAQQKNIVDISLMDIRDWAEGTHKSVDDKPYGGGDGMLLRVDVVDRALQAAIDMYEGPAFTMLMTPSGTRLSQPLVAKYAQHERLIILCGHYEGVDERIRSLVDAEVSIGDYVLTGGELPAMVTADAVVRLYEGALGSHSSTSEESFSLTDEGNMLLEYPQYTRPAEYKGMNVPEVLLSGHHKEIAAWRMDMARKRTKERRPDLERVKTVKTDHP